MDAAPLVGDDPVTDRREALRWRTGLERRPREAAGFYGVLSVATLVGLGLTFTALDPVRALLWSAVINGVVAVPVMVVMMLMAGNPKVMGEFTLAGWLRAMGWVATAVMALAALGLFLTWGR